MALITEIRFAAPSQPERFERELYEAFAGILQKNVEGRQLSQSHECLLISPQNSFRTYSRS